MLQYFQLKNSASKKLMMCRTSKF